MSGEGSATLWETFHARTGGMGSHPAVSGPSGTLTFAELWAHADTLASSFRRAGVADGAAVGVALPNTARFPVALLALCRLDAAVVLIPPQYRAGELSPVLSGLGLVDVVTHPGHAPGIAEAMPGARSSDCDGLLVLSSTGGEGKPLREPAALMKLSSGSTAEPKCIVLAAANVIAEAENVTATLGLGPGDRVLAGVPLFHSYGFDLGVLPALYAGSTLEVDDVFVPRRTLAALAERSPSAYLGVPAQYRAMLDARLDVAPDLTGVRWLLSCTAPLSADVVTAFGERFAAPICQHYGSSETGAATTHVPSEVLGRPASVGRAMEGVRVQVVSPDGTPLGPGAEGDVVVSSEAVARGYALGGPAGASPFRADGFWTGDVGRLDAEGFLTLLGRRDAVINVGGFKVSPEEVAATLERHPAVREAAVLGVSVALGEQVVWAAVALSERVDEAGLVAFCSGLLAEYKVPRRITVLDELPRTAAGKIRLRPEDVGA
jgi:long-chain acyl-CoA synthetase